MINFFNIKNTLTVLYLLFAVSLFSQNEWSKKLKSKESTFQEIKEDFDSEWQGRSYSKGHGWKQFHRWENFWEDRLMADGKFPNFREAFIDYKNFSNNKSQNAGNWLPLGPFSHENTASWSSGTGRVNVIVEDPNNSNIIYVGAPAGGIWKSIDAGSTWVPLGDEISVIGVSGIAIDPIDSDIIYIATGDADANDTYNIGLMKSTDGGTTWNLLQDIGQTNKILMDPSNNNVLWASSSNGLYKTTNAGATWNLMQSGNMRDMALKPGNSQTVYGVTSTQVYYTTNGGASFSISNGLSGSSTRLVIGVSDASPSIVYIIGTDNSGGFDDVYKSFNSGISFSSLNVPVDIFNGSTQSWYDLAIGVSDANANTLFCGVLNVWKSTNGGSTWTEINSWSNPNGAAYTHADIHYLNYYNGNFYCGSDGGIYKSTNNGNSFTDLTEGLQIGQFYKIGGSPNDANVLSGGLQDNGGYTWNGNTWRNYFGADGMDNAVDPNNSNRIYGLIQYGDMYYSTNGGLSNNGASSSGQEGRWVTPMQHDMNSNRLLVGYDDLFEYNTTANSWNQLSTFNFSDKIKNIEVYDGNSNVMVVSSGDDLYKTTNNGASFTNISGTLPNNISSIEMNPINANEIWVTIGGWSSGTKVYHTTNNGGVWTNISNGLPNLPAHMIKYDATNEGLYLGMDIGVYFRNEILGSWISYNVNLPNVIVNDIEINEAQSLVRIGTYGRGVWESGTYDVPVLATNAMLVSIDEPTGIQCDDSVTPQISVRNIGTDNITNLTITYNYDDGTNANYSWTGNITSGSVEVINLPTSIVVTGVHEFNIEITQVNGSSDGDASDNSGSSDFEYVEESEIVLNFTTDCYASETSWMIVEAGTANMVYSIELGALSNEIEYSDNLCLANGCYDLIVNDSYGDGLSSCDGGDYEILDGIGNSLVSMATQNFGFSATHNFCVADLGSLGCMDNTACNYDFNAEVDDGSCTYPGCTDETAINYNSAAGCEDNSCFYGLTNDDCSSPITLTEGTSIVYNTGSTGGSLEGDCWYGGDGEQTSVWYNFTTPSGSFSTSIETSDDGTASFPDTQLVLYSDCSGTVQLGCDDDAGVSLYSLINIECGELSSNTVYYLMVDGYNGDSGTCDLTIEFDTSVECGIMGCTDVAACNFDPEAVVEGDCVYAMGCDECDGEGGIIDNPEVGMSCDDGNVLTENDSVDTNCNCEGTPILFGCIDPNACNFNSQATQTDDSCIFATGCDVCDGEGGIIDNPEQGTSCNDGDPLTENDVIGNDCNCNGTPFGFGCMDELACNYDSEAIQSDDSCIYATGCDECNDEGGITDNPEIGAPCDDDNVLTENDVVGDDCNCEGTLIVFGCNDPNACNFNADATQNDGSCIYAAGCDICDDEGGIIDNPEVGTSCDDGDEMTENDVINDNCNCLGTLIVFGCDDPSACNFNIEATQNDDSCIYSTGCDSCDGNGGITDNPEIGMPCDDGNALTENDLVGNDCNCLGTLIPIGCMDESACNYDELATQSDDSCVYATGCDECDGDGGIDDNPEVGMPCDDENELTENDTVDENCNCQGTLIIFGCIDVEACNYDMLATQSDNTCEYETCAGCTDANASNYDSNATIEDGLCVFDCEYPIIEYIPFCDEENQDGYYIAMTISEIGNGAPYTVTNNQNDDEIILTFNGIINFGPYENDDNVVITVSSNVLAGCDITSPLLTMDCVVGIEELNSFDFDIYPNPNSGSFVISLADFNETIAVDCYDITGRMVYQTTVRSENKIEIDLENKIAKGSYFVKVETEKGILIKQLILE